MSVLKTRCLENLIKIISIYGKEIDTDLTEAIWMCFEKMAYETYRVGYNYLYPFKIIHLLWNLENLRPEVRQPFEKIVFDRWNDIYKASRAEPEDIEIPEDAPSSVETEPVATSADEPETYIPREEDIFDRFLTLVAALMKWR